MRDVVDAHGVSARTGPRLALCRYCRPGVASARRCNGWGGAVLRLARPWRQTEAAAMRQTQEHGQLLPWSEIPIAAMSAKLVQPACVCAPATPAARLPQMRSAGALSRSPRRCAAPVAAQRGIKHMGAPAPVDLQIALRDAFVFEARIFPASPREAAFSGRQAASIRLRSSRCKGVVHHGLRSPRACSPAARSGSPIQ